MTADNKTHRVVGINGGPRKNWNTAMLLEETLKGSASQGAATELIHLYDLDYKGCKSCFYCKTKENYLKGRCAQKDGLSPVLDLLANSTGVVMGSPIYISDVTGALRSFI
ncbi:MAG: flavodoxin family protein [Deltaproteobacteria bacterium]|jgi:multimeric flavodoxin WrbA|nr:flavodoxin family protein [Deltaproteobacteria bacterium]